MYNKIHSPLHQIIHSLTHFNYTTIQTQASSPLYHSLLGLYYAQGRAHGDAYSMCDLMGCSSHKTCCFPQYVSCILSQMMTDFHTANRNHE